MSRVRKDEILERLVFSDAVVEAYARPERDLSEPACDHWSGPVLLERLAYLRKLAHFDQGMANDPLREFPGYSLSLLTLMRSGDAQVDEDHGTIMLVLDGRATLVSGGTLERARRVAPGELKGTSIAGGENRELRRGDAAHVAAGLPHQLLIRDDGRLGVLMIRVHEKREDN